MKDLAARIPVWAWVTMAFLLVLLVATGALLYGIAGVGRIDVTVTSEDQGGCTFAMEWIELSKATDHHYGCLRYQVGHCEIVFGRACLEVRQMAE